MLDMWQTDGEGLYEEEQRSTIEPWMRGIYYSQPDGSYSMRTVAPISYYSIPMDGPVGALMERTDMSHIRPAHIHFAISKPRYHYLVTHLFRKGDEYIDRDVVYGVKDALIVEFVKKPPGKAPNGDMVDVPFYEVKYDFVHGRRHLRFQELLDHTAHQWTQKSGSSAIIAWISFVPSVNSLLGHGSIFSWLVFSAPNCLP
jgi:protocatechuate 3,4-dioxygenase beta subunit